MNWEGPLTHRQFMAWKAWDEADMSRPGKLEHYVMQTACEIRRVLSKTPSSIKLEHFKLRFIRQKQKASEEHAKNVAEIAKKTWVMRVGGRVVITDRPDPPQPSPREDDVVPVEMT